MTPFLIDTNVLLRAIQGNNLSLRELARNAIRKLHRRGDELCLCPQNLVELWNVSTRPAAANGLGMTISECRRNLTRCESFFRVLPETPSIFREWKRLVFEYQVSGLKVHDAKLVAAMAVHGIPAIVTFDTGDFIRYVPAISVVHPQDV